MSDIREVANPHDAIFVDCGDMEAARLAVLAVGMGAYGIEGDDGLPILLWGADTWVQETYQMSLEEWMASVDKLRVATALESFSLCGERSSISDPVGKAHRLAQSIREHYDSEGA